MKLADRVYKISPSPTLALDAKAKEMLSQGINVVNFGVGEPDFDTPQHIKDAAIDAINKGFTKYTPASGIAELKAAVVKKFKEDNGLEYKPSQVIVSVGAKHSIFNAVMAVINEGDECIIPAPYWVSYPEMVNIAGGKSVIIPLTEAENFKLTAEKLEKAITPKSKMIILNTPSNPTGSVYNKEELKAVADVCKKHDIVIVSDEVYEKLMYDQAKHVSIASVSEDAYKRTVTVNGVSKAYAMTGWRIGYAAANQEIVTAMSNIQGHVTTNPTSISQKAAVAGLLGPQEPLKKMLEAFRERADYTYKRVNEIPGFFCRKPLGAFYVFPNVAKVFGKKVAGQVIENADQLCALFLEKAQVAIVPGSGFGSPDNIRISYATSMEKIVDGLNRVDALLKGVL